MQYDFIFNGTRYMLNWDDPLCTDRTDGIQTVQLRVYYSLESDSLFSSSIKQILDNKIIWHPSDNMYLSKLAQDHCDKLLKNKVFF